jgi:hypothetical protein
LVRASYRHRPSLDCQFSKNLLSVCDCFCGPFVNTRDLTRACLVIHEASQTISAAMTTMAR